MSDDEDALLRLMPKRAKDIGPAAIAKRARWLVERDRIEDAVVLWRIAAQRGDASVAREYETAAGLALAKADRFDEARPWFDRALGRDPPPRLIDHVYFHLLRAAAAAGDRVGFRRWFEAAAEGSDRIFPWIRPDQVELLEAAADLEAWSELGAVVGAIEHNRGKVERALAKRIDALRQRVPDGSPFEQARQRVVQQGAALREASRPPPTLPAKPDSARAFDPSTVSRTLTRGLFIAVTDAELRDLRRNKRDADRRAYVTALEERAEPKWCCGTDKSWRFLELLLADRRTSAPNIDVFFNKHLHRAQYHRIELLAGDDLAAVAAALAEMDATALHDRWVTWTTEDFRYHLGPVFIPTFDYLATWYERVREFIARAAEARRNVIFDADS